MIAAESPSRALLNLAAPNTSRADQNPAHIAANLGADVLQIRIPAPLGFVVGVTDVVADRRMLLAVCAMSHWISDLSDLSGTASQISPPKAAVEEGYAPDLCPSLFHLCVIPVFFVSSQAEGLFFRHLERSPRSRRTSDLRRSSSSVDSYLARYFTGEGLVAERRGR